jgi:hypothetical protein
MCFAWFTTQATGCSFTMQYWTLVFGMKTVFTARLELNYYEEISIAWNVLQCHPACTQCDVQYQQGTSSNKQRYNTTQTTIICRYNYLLERILSRFLAVRACFSAVMHNDTAGRFAGLPARTDRRRVCVQHVGDVQITTSWALASRSPVWKKRSQFNSGLQTCPSLLSDVN